jgi:EpsI family protein
MTTFLQGVSSELGVWFIRLAGIPVFLEGNIIDLAFAEAAGGRGLFGPAIPVPDPVLLLSLRDPLSRAALAQGGAACCLAAPLTVFMNSFRIGMIGVIVNSYGLGWVEGFTAFLRRLGDLHRLCRDPVPDGGDPAAHHAQSHAAEPGHRPGYGRLGRISTRVLELPRQAVTVGGRRTDRAGLGRGPGPATAGGARARPTSFVVFPRDVGDWSRPRTDFDDPEIEAVLGADDYANITYQTDLSTPSVNFFSAFYERQTEGSGIHSPEVCLPAGGWEIFSLEAHEVSFPETPFGSFEVNRAIIQNGQSRQLVYYWFEQRGQRFTNDFIAKLWVVWDSLIHDRTDGALVRFVTPIEPGDPPAAADARIQALMAEILPRLPQFIPDMDRSG